MWFNFDEVLGRPLAGVDEEDLQLTSMEQQWEFDESQESFLGRIHQGLSISLEAC